MTLQAQAERERHEVALQRKELMKHLGAVPEAAAQEAHAPTGPEAAPPGTEEGSPSPGDATGPAEASAEPVKSVADQMRKLRRDARRRAMGEL